MAQFNNRASLKRPRRGRSVFPRRTCSLGQCLGAMPMLLIRMLNNFFLSSSEAISDAKTSIARQVVHPNHYVRNVMFRWVNTIKLKQFLGPFKASFFIYFRLFNKQITANMFSKSCQWLDSNQGPLVSEATALPTAPQPQPKN